MKKFIVYIGVFILIGFFTKGLIHFYKLYMDFGKKNLTAFMDETVEPTIEVANMNVADVTKGSELVGAGWLMSSIDTYRVVLQSTDNSVEPVILEKEEDYNTFLPYISQDVDIVFIWHGDTKDVNFMEYKIVK